MGAFVEETPPPSTSPRPSSFVIPLPSPSSTSRVGAIPPRALDLTGVQQEGGDRRDYFICSVQANDQRGATPPPPLPSPSPPPMTEEIRQAEEQALQHSLRFARGRQGASTAPARQAQFCRLPESQQWVLDLGRGASHKRIRVYLHEPEDTQPQTTVCAGCAHPFSSPRDRRYCYWYGEYYCHDCHHGQLVILPARVLQSWDWQPVPVCQQAKEWSDALVDVPLYDIQRLAPNLYRRVEMLKSIRTIRQQINYMREYVQVCQKHTLRLSLPRHLFWDTQVYALGDLHAVERGTLSRSLQQSASLLLDHIRSCETCLAKGFICEFCQDPKPIYPFDVKNVVACRGCRGFFHRRCYRPTACPKCQRIESSPHLSRRIKSPG